MVESGSSFRSGVEREIGEGSNSVELETQRQWCGVNRKSKMDCRRVVSKGKEVCFVEKVVYTDSTTLKKFTADD